MICPHCKKPISNQISDADKKKVMKLYKQGYSFRDIESILERRVSFSSASRIVKKHKGLK